MKYILILLLLLSGCSPVKDSNESPLPTPSAPSPTPTEITNNEVAQTPIPTEEVVVTTPHPQAQTMMQIMQKQSLLKQILKDCSQLIF